MQTNLRPSGVTTAMTQFGIVLPSQHYGTRRGQAPEEQLMIAVLHDARDCLEKYRLATNHHGQRLFREASQWFLADEPDWPYSFECICLVLDLDSEAVRRRLRVASVRHAPSASCAAAARPRTRIAEGVVNAD